MTVREILDDPKNEVYGMYIEDIRRFSKRGLVTNTIKPEDRAIESICDIYFYMGTISEKQKEWLIRYANKHKITGTTRVQNKVSINFKTKQTNEKS